MYETRGEAKYYYSYDANGILYNVKYTLTDDSEMKSYFYTHNSRGDIVGIYSGSGVLTAQYEYDVWGNILSITDGSGNVITDPNNVGNLNPFRYRGYYYDSDTGLYYLMSRYYDPVTHRFLNSDGYFQSGGGILDANMNAYCRNNPIMFVDPTGEKCYLNDTGRAGPPCPGSDIQDCCYIYNGYNYKECHYVSSSKSQNIKGGDNWKSRKDSKKGAEVRQKTGARERNVAHPNSEEHSRVHKGNGVKRISEFNFVDNIGIIVISVVCVGAMVYFIGNNATLIGFIDDFAIIPTATLFWDNLSKVVVKA